MQNLRYTRNSSGHEIANVNFLYDDIVHAQSTNTIDSYIDSATDRRGYVLEHKFTKFSEITQCNGGRPLRRSRSFKVTDYNRYKFSLARAGHLVLTLSLG